MTVKTPVQQLEEQKTRLATLQERHTRVQVKLEAERQALQEAQAEALALFGTSDLEELRNLFRQRQVDNERQVADFIQALDDVERRLGDVERQTQAS